jgi:hypothetical protein
MTAITPILTAKASSPRLARGRPAGIAIAEFLDPAIGLSPVRN